MKVISPIFSSMRGKLGGAVGAVSRGGVAYLRALVIPGNPRSLYQTTVRLILTALAASWRGTLTSLQRAGWTAIAPSESSGIDAYIKANTQLLLAGQTRADDAPDSAALVTNPLLTCVVDASAHTITFTGGGASSEISVNGYISRAQFESRDAQEFNFTFAGTWVDTSAGFSIPIPVGHPAYNLVAGDIVYVRGVQFGNDTAASTIQPGQVAPAQDFRVVVVA